MPLTDTKPDAVAAVYARSLYELAEQRGGAAAVESALAQLEDVLELARHDARFSEFLASRVLSAEARDRSLRAIFDGRVDELVLRFLLVLNDKNRLGHLPAIAAAYDAMVQERLGRVEADVYTASAIDTAQLGAIRDRLAAKLGKDVIVHPYTDPAMIGGIRLRIGDQLIDASVATRLRRMRDQLANQGLARIKAGAQGLLGE